jgi:hypothetical protein
VCQEDAYPALRMALRLDRAGIRALHAPRVVQSIYLDTIFGRALEENLAGLSCREKVRWRWYGTERGLVRGTLERKRRENALGWKESLALSEPVAVLGAPRRSFVERLAALATTAWRARLLHGLEPVQWIAYRREYLESADRRVRLTIDRELACHDQRHLPRLSDAHPSPLPRLLVLELKCAPGDLERAQEIASRLPLPLGRCSKFVLASQPAHGPLPTWLEP